MIRDVRDRFEQFVVHDADVPDAEVTDQLVTIGREAEPSAAIIDSQTVKTTEKGDLAATMQARKSRDVNDIS